MRRSHRFSESLYEMAAENRGLLLTFFSTAVFEPEVFAAARCRRHDPRESGRARRGVRDRTRLLGVDLAGYDVLISSRLVVGTILALALFDGVLLPTGDRARNKDQVLTELTRQVLYGGFNIRPPAGQ